MALHALVLGPWIIADDHEMDSAVQMEDAGVYNWQTSSLPSLAVKGRHARPAPEANMSGCMGLLILACCVNL